VVGLERVERLVERRRDGWCGATAGSSTARLLTLAATWIARPVSAAEISHPD
jgi:hypothetical protein